MADLDRLRIAVCDAARDAAEAWPRAARHDAWGELVIVAGDLARPLQRLAAAVAEYDRADLATRVATMREAQGETDG